MAAIKKPARLMLDIAKWKRETAAMSAPDIGALLLLKVHFWSTGPIPDNDRALSRITCMDLTEWKPTRKTLEPLFIVKHGEWTRIDWSDELETAYEAVRKAGEKSQKGHAARWKKNASGNAPSNASCMPQAMPPCMLKNKSDKPQSPKAPSQGNDGFLSGDDVVPPDCLEDLKAAEDSFLAGVGGPVVGFGGVE